MSYYESYLPTTADEDLNLGTNGSNHESYAAVPTSADVVIGNIAAGNNAELSIGIDRLEKYRRIAKIDPFSFWGFDCGCDGCDDVAWLKYHWQAESGRIGRDDVRQALRDAEQKLSSVTRIAAGVRWFSERVKLPELFSTDRRHSAIQLSHNCIQKLGVPVYKRIGATNVVLKMADGSNFVEDHKRSPFMFTATLPLLPGIDISTVQAHVHVDYRLGDVNDTTRIPATIKVTGENIVVTGNVWLLGSPKHWESRRPSALNCTAASSYMKRVELHTLVNRTDGVTLDDATVVLHGQSADVVSRGGIRNNGRTGLVYASRERYSDENWSSNHFSDDQPREATIRYMTGSDGQRGFANYNLLLAKLATGLLPSICSNCSSVDSSFFRKWSEDKAQKNGSFDKYNFTFADLDSVWGTTRGAISAYKEVMSPRGQIGRGVVL